MFFVPLQNMHLNYYLWSRL